MGQADRRDHARIERITRALFKADYWNANIERWIYVTGAEIDRQVGVEGHYVRVSPPDKADADCSARPGGCAH
jgi:hypothetical protein